MGSLAVTSMAPAHAAEICFDGGGDGAAPGAVAVAYEESEDEADDAMQTDEEGAFLLNDEDEDYDFLEDELDSDEDDAADARHVQPVFRVDIELMEPYLRQMMDEEFDARELAKHDKEKGKREEARRIFLERCVAQPPSRRTTTHRCVLSSQRCCCCC
jgi:hypothetical protein